jgi:hypothetical protein
MCATAATHGRPEAPALATKHNSNNPSTVAETSCYDGAMQRPMLPCTATALPHHSRLPAAASSCAIRSRSPDDVLSSMSPVSIT